MSPFDSRTASSCSVTSILLPPCPRCSAPWVCDIRWRKCWEPPRLRRHATASSRGGPGSAGVSPAQANAVNQNAGGDARAPRMREQMPPNVAHPRSIRVYLLLQARGPGRSTMSIRKEVGGNERPGGGAVRGPEPDVVRRAGGVPAPVLASVPVRSGLRGCFRHESGRLAYVPHAVALLVHLLLGCRELRDMARYRNDEAVHRAVGLRRLPDVSTVSRALSDMDAHAATDGCGRWPGSWRWSGCGTCRSGGSRWTSTARCWARGGWRRVPRYLEPLPT